jgi:hypothetical protein
MEQFTKVVPLIKWDERDHLVWGVGCSETPDADGEICDYPAAKAEFMRWSEEFRQRTSNAGQAESLGCVRLMHGLTIAGKLIKITFDDSKKQILVGATPANEEILKMLRLGMLTGFSIGGGYTWKRPEGKYTRYGCRLSEISLVDNPSNPDAVYEFVNADGATTLVKFNRKGDSDMFPNPRTGAAVPQTSRGTCPACLQQIPHSKRPGDKLDCPNCKSALEVDDTGKLIPQKPQYKVAKGETSMRRTAHDHLLDCAKHERALSEKHHGIGAQHSKLAAAHRLDGQDSIAECHKALSDHHHAIGAAHRNHAELCEKLATEAIMSCRHVERPGDGCR